MLDFVTICTFTKSSKTSDGTITIFPEFLVGRTDDLMIKGGEFYAVWDEEAGFWTRNEGRVCDIVDDMLREARDRYPKDVELEVKWMRSFGSKKWTEFLSYCRSLPDNSVGLDERIIFAGQPVTKEDHATKTLPYGLSKSSISAYDELMSTLYSEKERQKLEWAIGSVFAGDSRWIQKFVVLYGEAGSGKSTVLNIIQMLFEGYFSTFEAKGLGQASNAFALEAFSDDPLVAIQHDGDLSHIEDNTRLNQLVAHEPLVVNEKYKRTYSQAFHTFLFMGTNSPVRITDAKSGMIRRLLDVRPSGRKVRFDRYQRLMEQIRFELGGIASHCIDVYSALGPSAYDAYRPLEMMGATNDFYNFVEDHYDIFSKEEVITLKQAWAMYKEWAEQAAVRYTASMRAVKEELKLYFDEFHERYHPAEGTYLRNVYKGFRAFKLGVSGLEDLEYQNGPSEGLRVVLSYIPSLLDEALSDCKAQYAKEDGTPERRWADVGTTLADIDTARLHYVQVPENHIVIDFDIPDEDGAKDLDANLEAASLWPPTYAELSKSGKGVHLHYIYDGDVEELAPSYADHIEIKVYSGNASLRRQLTMCNDVPIATISSGLPKRKGGEKVIDFEGLRNEKALRTVILKSMKKEYQPGTITNVEWIAKVLAQAYSSGMVYDVSDLETAILSFCNNSTHHSRRCAQIFKDEIAPYLKSEVEGENLETESNDIIFYDVEVFPNLFVVVFKRPGEDKKPVRMINPKPSDVESLMRYRLIGFNNRRYDNHILYGSLLGYSNEALFGLSQAIIGGSKGAMFREAYNISYTDIYDFSSKKQSLKKWEIELGIHHQELGLPWSEPVPEELWEKVALYCENDVIATEAVFNARQDDFHAREMLASLSGLSVNDTNRQHTTKIIFGNDRHPQDKFVYTDLSTLFPGYSYEFGKSVYRGETVGEGGYVYAEPGMYFGKIKVFDVASMHPTSIRELDIFGPYTRNFNELVDARLAIKHRDYETASKMLGGKLDPFLGNPEDADKLAYALKIVINSVYGLTAARFDCEFKDPRNVDNIVAKRGALFMIDLKHKVQEAGGRVIHIKTDSIKIVNPTPEVEDLVYSYGSQWGYTFEVEDVYDRICLVNDAVYIAKHAGGSWTATGAQFQVPYIFKSLFSHEDLVFDDYCETKSVTGESALYLDMNENLADGEHDYRFVGKAGQFTPIFPGRGGGLLMREKDGKYYSVTGTKGYRWLESELVRFTNREDDADISYYEDLLAKAVSTISEFGDFDKFVKE